MLTGSPTWFEARLSLLTFESAAPAMLVNECGQAQTSFILYFYKLETRICVLT